jgi:hypothetical protein
MCILVNNRIDCIEHNYPISESRYINNGLLNHNSTQEEIENYIKNCDNSGIYTKTTPRDTLIKLKHENKRNNSKTPTTL